MKFENYVERNARLGWKAKAAGIAVLSVTLGGMAVPVAWLIAGASSQKGGGLGFVHAPYSPGYSNCWWDNAQANTQGKIGLSCYAIS